MPEAGLTIWWILNQGKSSHGPVAASVCSSDLTTPWVSWEGPFAETTKRSAQ